MNFLYDSLKLLKYEFLTSKLLFLLTLIVTFFNVLLLIANKNEYGDGILISIYIITFFAFFTLFVAYVLSISKSFYKSMFGEYAYLTHAMPIGTDSILIGKILTFFIWIIAIILNVLFFIYNSGVMDYIHQKELIINLVLYLLLASLYEICYLMMIITIVHKKKKNIMLHGMLTYFGIKTLKIIIITIIVSNSEAFHYIYSTEMANIALIVGIIIYYLICRYIIRNHLAL